MSALFVLEKRLNTLLSAALPPGLFVHHMSVLPAHKNMADIALRDTYQQKRLILEPKRSIHSLCFFWFLIPNPIILWELKIVIPQEKIVMTLERH